jgi:dTDP-4-amino-4,6-dideoxygalactose transaminase
MTHATSKDALRRVAESFLRDEVATSRTTAFEEALAARTGAQHAVAVASSTVAFQIAYRALGLAHGATVLSSSLADPTVVRSTVACGLRPRFVDVDGRGHLTASAVAAYASLHGAPAVIVPSHFAGHPCDLAALAAAAPSALIVDDATDALGAMHTDGRMVGASGVAAMTVLGLGPVRASTPMFGAVITTDDARLAARCRTLRDERAESRASELHAALGHVQLGRLSATLALREEIATSYDVALASLALAEAVRPAAGSRSAWGVYPFRVPAWLRPAVVEQLASWGIGGRRVSMLLHRHPYFGRYADVLPAELPATERFAAEVVFLPTAVAAEDRNVLRITDALAAAVGSGAERAHLAG